MVRPAGFDPAAYGFEEQDSENLKMSYFQPLDSINFCNVFLVSFGTVWKYLTLTGTIWAQSSFGQMDHLGQLFLQMAGLGTALHLRRPPPSCPWTGSSSDTQQNAGDNPCHSSYQYHRWSYGWRSGRPSPHSTGSRARSRGQWP